MEYISEEEDEVNRSVDMNQSDSNSDDTSDDQGIPSSAAAVLPKTGTREEQNDIFIPNNHQLEASVTKQRELLMQDSQGEVSYMVRDSKGEMYFVDVSTSHTVDRKQVKRHTYLKVDNNKQDHSLEVQKVSQGEEKGEISVYEINIMTESTPGDNQYDCSRVEPTDNDEDTTAPDSDSMTNDPIYHDIPRQDTVVNTGKPYFDFGCCSLIPCSNVGRETGRTDVNGNEDKERKKYWFLCGFLILGVIIIVLLVSLIVHYKLQET